MFGEMFGGLGRNMGELGNSWSSMLQPGRPPTMGTPTPGGMPQGMVGAPGGMMPGLMGAPAPGGMPRGIPPAPMAPVMNTLHPAGTQQPFMHGRLNRGSR